MGRETKGNSVYFAWRREETLLLSVAGGLMVLFGLVTKDAPVNLHVRTLALLMFGLLMAGYLLWAAGAWVESWRRAVAADRRWVWWLALGLLGLGWFYALATGQLVDAVGERIRWEVLVRLSLYVMAPTAVFVLWPPREPGLTWADGLVILLIWFPVEFDWLPRLDLPPGGPADLSLLLALNLVLFLFLVARPLDLGYTFRVRGREMGVGVLCFLGFAVVGLPVGFALDFIAWNPRVTSLLDVAAKGLYIFLFTGLVEELLFRGLIQNLLEKRLRGRHAALVALFLTSVVFGLAHLNNRERMEGLPGPNWRYALLATLAGLAYGAAWLRTRKIVPAALTHTLVDWMWVLCFTAD
ncbi:MAG TPA: CPBP family intramembrane metalloprotease [Armatimonadetes bacterium]|nr:CPBP family intramembrane metalloprotease [Armatimonadota bacterium]